MFTVGQEVFSSNHGKGVVTAIDEYALIYPVEVTFINGLVERYTQGGKEFISEDQPSLVKFKGSSMIKFYVGQKVWCVIFGEGVVAEITHGVYPVKVRFENGEVDTYTSEGHLLSRGNQSLFQHPVKIVQDESATKPSINWEHVSSEFNYLAEDADGGVLLYEDKPFTATETWTAYNGELAQAHMFASYTKGTCDWKESLIERPKN